MVKMSDKLKQKLEYTLIGGAFSLLNCYAVLNGHTLFGIGFGITAAIFYVRALRIK